MPRLLLRSGRSRLSAHPATLGFAALEVAGLITYLVLGRHLWFYSDEWDYVVDRHPLSDPASLFRAHNGQWQTIPIVIYRVLLHFTGLRHYWPYLLLVVALYLSTCALTYALMLISGVRPWVAVVPSAALVFLGVANENVVFGAQITYLGSIALGLGQLLVVSLGHNRRHIVPVVVMGVAALMCSNLGVVTAVVVAIAVLLREGWRPALVITAPPALVFVVWWTSFGAAASTGLSSAIRFTWVGLRATGRDYSQFGDVGFAAVSMVLVAGVILVGRHHRERLPMVVALITGAIAFLLVTGSQRATAFGAHSAEAPRYVGVVVILLVPVAGIAADVLLTWQRATGALAIAMLLVGVPGNVAALGRITTRSEHIADTRRLILILPTLPATASVPADLRPFPESNLAPLLTVGYLRTAARHGRLPQTPAATAGDRLTVRFRLRIYQTFASSAPVGCRALLSPVDVAVRTGEALRIAGGFVSVTNLSSGGEHGRRVVYNPNRGNVLRVLDGTLTLRLATYGINGRAGLCRK